MRNTARGIIFIDGKLLTIYRKVLKIDGWNEYYIIPGGGIEENEIPEQTVIREIKEETNLDVKIKKYVGMDFNNGTHSFFLCDVIGKPDIKLCGPEKKECSDINYYEPKLIPLEEIDNIELIGKQFVLDAIKMEGLN